MSQGLPNRCTAMMALVRDVIFASTSLGSMLYVSSTSAKTGTQLCRSIPMIEPAEVQGVTMISLPGSGLMAPMHTCMAAVPEVTVTPHLTPCLSAKSRSNREI